MNSNQMRGKQDNSFVSGKRFHSNKGFSLIELLVSVAILGIIILPLLNNFVAAAKVNQKAKKIQNETIYARDIVEQVKGKSLDQTSMEYNFPADFPGAGTNVSEVKPGVGGGFLSVSEAEKSTVRELVNNSDGTTSYRYILKNKTDAPYYFAKMNETYGNQKYDVLISFDPRKYIKTLPSGDTTGYNTFKMPDISEINTKNNAVILQSNEEDQAVAALYSSHLTYCSQQDILNASVPGYIPMVRFSESQIRSNLYRTMTVKLSKVIDKIQVTAEFEYGSIGIPGAGTALFTLYDERIDNPAKSVYLFYHAVSMHSAHINGRDKLIIMKDPTISEPMDFYLVKQAFECTCTVVNYSVVEGAAIPAGITLRSNVIVGTAATDLIKKDSTPKNRIYDIRVQLYKAGTNFATDSLCSEFQSAKGE